MCTVDIRTDFHIAINNISNWKNSYERKIYVHRKLLINIMFRAICTKFVYEAFKDGEMLDSSNVEEATQYVEDFYKGMAENIMPKLIGWLRNMQNDEMVGTVNYHFYKCLAYDAEIKDDSMHELEFIETRRFTFKEKTYHDSCDGFHICNLVDGSAAVIESVGGEFEPFTVHYAETFIIPAAVGKYTIRPLHNDETVMVLKAFVRNR